MEKLNLIDYLYKALESPFGIELCTDNPVSLRQQLYAIIREEREKLNPIFDSIHLSLSPSHPQSFLWIIHAEKTSRIPDSEVLLPPTSGADCAVE